MGFPRYPEYKDSEVWWLGEVPKRWNCNPARRYLRRLKELNTGMICEDRLALTMGGVVPRSLDDVDGLQATEYETYQIFEANDLVFKLIDLQNIKTSRVGLVPNKGIMSPAYIRLQIFNSDLIHQYAYWYYTNMYKLNVFNELGGGVRQTLGASELLTYAILAPSLDEQQAIADFLDRETSKIDALVAEQQRLIELLKEKRQAVISHAVTKGLNPNAPMKPSGIPWLGDVPEHWTISALKNYVNTINGFGFKSSDFQDDGVPLIRAGNIKNKSIRQPTIFLPESAVENYDRVRLRANDIVISMVGSDPKVLESAVGQVGIVPPNLAGAVPNQNVVILREDSDNVLSKFLFYSLCSTAYRNHLNVFSHKLANQSIISSSLLVAATFCFPDKEEQQSITSFLDQRVDLFNRLIDEAEQVILILQERRTALISAAVTGKVDVRSDAPNITCLELS